MRYFTIKKRLIQQWVAVVAVLMVSGLVWANKEPQSVAPGQAGISATHIKTDMIVNALKGKKYSYLHHQQKGKDYSFLHHKAR